MKEIYGSNIYNIYYFYLNAKRETVAIEIR